MSKTVVNLFKLVMILIVGMASADMLGVWYHAFILGGYYHSAGIFLSALGFLFPAAIILGMLGIIYKISQTTPDLREDNE